MLLLFLSVEVVVVVADEEVVLVVSEGVYL